MTKAPMTASAPKVAESVAAAAAKGARVVEERMDAVVSVVATAERPRPKYEGC